MNNQISYIDFDGAGRITVLKGSFEWAMDHARIGLKVTRQKWSSKNYNYNDLTTEDKEANDWILL